VYAWEALKRELELDQVSDKQTLGKFVINYISALCYDNTSNSDEE